VTTATAHTNKLFFGDNLEVLRSQVRDESVDLIYLDPPFNSNANYNILFAPPKALRTTVDERHAQIQAFEDSWQWNDTAEDAFDRVSRSGNTRAFDLLNAFRTFLGENDMMAYLTMMSVRLLELHRVLKPSGSLYLHCDPTASHYLKLLLDGVFGFRMFRSEIIWKRTSAHANSTKNLAGVHDVILLVGKGGNPMHNESFTPYSPSYVAEHFVHVDPDGRRFRRSDLRNPGVRPNLRYDYQATNGITYKPHPNGWAVSRDVMERLDREGRLFFPRKEGGRLRKKIYLEEGAGVPLTDVWEDLPPIHASAAERLGYPTQKPLALLERIVAASSNEGDVVLDPFCGCGTAIHAAQKLGRRWIGIDVTHLAISLIEKRMRHAFPDIRLAVEGTPKDLASAEDLAARDKYQFQWWAVSMVDAMPFGGKKKGADGGIDGIIYFKPDARRTEKAIVSVKGGDSVGVQMIRDLHSTMEREKAPIGVFITKSLPSGPMEREAAAVGRFHSETTGKSYARLQILTLVDLFKGKRPDIPYVDPGAAFRQAPREDGTKQASLF
jgi:site-specific DNA-methyltransferase (adenine-specific)